MKNLSLLIVLTVAIFAFSGSSVTFARNCVKGKACGDTCIPMSSTCHIMAKPVNEASVIGKQATQDLKTADMNVKSDSKVCKTGKPCGKTCISVKAICRADGSFNLAKRHK